MVGRGCLVQDIMSDEAVATLYDMEYEVLNHEDGVTSIHQGL